MVISSSSVRPPSSRDDHREGESALLDGTTCERQDRSGMCFGPSGAMSWQAVLHVHFDRDAT
jgi:hypothetical protein